MGEPSDDLRNRICGLTCWTGPVDIQPVPGGMTNANFLVKHRGNLYFVRLGADIPVHGVMRFNELAATRAAAECGLSPRVHYAATGVIVLDWLEAMPLTAAALRRPDIMLRVVELLRICHHDMIHHLRGPALIFWVFHVLRDYAATLRENRSRYTSVLDRLTAIASDLEHHIGAIDIAFGHNDLLPANILDDGRRLWLVDWDYAGFGSPLFDLANLSSNCGFDSADDDRLLSAYFGCPADLGLVRRFRAMTCASLLREAMWSMISELFSKIDFDYPTYTRENMARFEQAYDRLLAERNVS